MTKIGTWAGALAALAVLTASAAAADWPQWMGPDRNGVSPETGWQTSWPEGGPPKLWQKDLGRGYSSPAVIGDRLYTLGYADGQDTVWCLNAATGEVIWQQSYAAEKGGNWPGPLGAPAVAGAHLYTMSRDGQALCLSVESGEIRWQKHLRKAFGIPEEPSGWGLVSSPLVLDELVIYDLGKAVALNRLTGEKVWLSEPDTPGFSSSVAFEHEGKRYVTSFFAKGLKVLDALTGREAARFPWETRYDVNCATPLVKDSHIFISSGYRKGGALLKFDGASLTRVYATEAMANHCQNAVLHEGHLYGLSGNIGGRGDLVCMDFMTGEVKWEEGPYKVGNLSAAGGVLIGVDDGGDVWLAKATPAGFTELAKAEDGLPKKCWTPPVLAGGRLFLRNDQGQMACLDVSGQ